MTIDAKTFWRILGERATGVPIVTAQGSEGPAGFLGLSATHVTADPPTMLVSIDDRTSALAAVLHSRHFAINYLPANAQDIADAFSGKSTHKGAERFDPARWQTLATGAPVFKEAIGAVDCELVESVRYGSTTIAIGRVVDAVSKSTGKPLFYFRGKYLAL